MSAAPIVVGIDISLGTARAVEWAVGEAERRRCGLRLVHVPDSADAEVAEELTGGGSPDAVGETMLAISRSMATRLQPDVPVEAVLRHGTPAEALVDECPDARLLVVGANGVAGYGRSALGSVAYRVATHAGCPVVVVSSRALVEQPRRILAGVDAADSSGPAVLGYAEQAAAASDAQVVQLDVSEHEDAAGALLEASRSADLVVLGARHADERFSSRLGSVAAGVLPFIECPVALVSRPAEGTA